MTTEKSKPEHAAHAAQAGRGADAAYAADAEKAKTAEAKHAAFTHPSGAVMIPPHEHDPNAPYVPKLGDIVTLKSGGPSMIIVGLDGASVNQPGGPATDPEITPERKYAGQTTPPQFLTGNAQMAECQWFNTKDGTSCKEKFPVSALCCAEHDHKGFEKNAWKHESK